MLAVASGKGGVGKSSLTVDLALALRAQGHEVGIVDADIYGFSIPGMLGIDQRPVTVDSMIVPPVAHEVKTRLDRLLPRRRGRRDVARADARRRRSSSSCPMSTGARLDYLLVDMPPGTGDVAISLGQLGLPPRRSLRRDHAEPDGAAGGRARRRGLRTG